MADVFISYKREDRAFAEKVDATLKSQGLSTWWDTSLVAGEHFNHSIDRELNAARAVVVLWSEAAHASRWVNAEAVSGFDRGILVAARLDDVALAYPFNVVQTTDLRSSGGLAQLVAGVRLKLEGGALPHHAQSSGVVKRGAKSGILVGAVATVAIALAAGATFLATRNASTPKEIAAEAPAAEPVNPLVAQVASFSGKWAIDPKNCPQPEDGPVGPWFTVAGAYPEIETITSAGRNIYKVVGASEGWVAAEGPRNIQFRLTPSGALQMRGASSDQPLSMEKCT